LPSYYQLSIWDQFFIAFFAFPGQNIFQFSRKWCLTFYRWAYS